MESALVNQTLEVHTVGNVQKATTTFQNANVKGLNGLTWTVSNRFNF